MLKKTLIYWRDIPSQVIVQQGRRREKAVLSARFQQAIDRAAMRAGKGSSEAYLDEWRRVSSNCDTGAGIALQDFAAREASRLEAEYPDELLLELIRNHGLKEESACTG